MACIGYLSRPTFLRTAVGAAAHCGGGAAPARAASACGAYASAAPSSSESETRVLTIMGANCAVATPEEGGCTILREASASRVGFLRLSVLCLVISILPVLFKHGLAGVSTSEK